MSIVKAIERREWITVLLFLAMPTITHAWLIYENLAYKLLQDLNDLRLEVGFTINLLHVGIKWNLILKQLLSWWATWESKLKTYFTWESKPTQEQQLEHHLNEMNLIPPSAPKKWMRSVSPTFWSRKAWQTYNSWMLDHYQFPSQLKGKLRYIDYVSLQAMYQTDISLFHSRSH
jgi:hypothetical protein